MLFLNDLYKGNQPNDIRNGKEVLYSIIIL